MGRTITAEENIQFALEKLFQRDTWTIGLIVGQISSQRDYAVHLAATPQAEDGPGQEAKSSTVSLDSVDEAWLATHARQVLRMLPGGLDILGIFVIAAPDIMKAAQAKLRQMLFAVHKTVAKELQYVMGQDPQLSQSVTEGASDRVLLQICPVTKKITCRTFDVSDHKSTAKPADWKYQSIADRWHCVQTSVCVDHVIPIQLAATSHSLERQILMGLQPLIDNIWNSLTTLDGSLVPRDDPLVASQPSTGKKGKRQQEEPGGRTFDAQLLEKCLPSSSDQGPDIMDCVAKLTVRGTLSCQAFVHSKATVRDATQAIKLDVIRSLVSRCELLCEDLLQTEEDQDPKVLYETPVRIFAPLCGQVLQACDYIFQDETADDSCDRFRDLLGLTIASDQLEMESERVPEESELIRPEKTVVDGEAFSTQTRSQHSTLTLIRTVAYVAAAGLAAALSYVIYDSQ